MTFPRRSVLQAGLSLTVDLLAAPSWAASPPRFRAVAFDAFPVFDPRSIAILAETLFAGMGPDLINRWRTRQFEYTWLRTAAGTYTDFMRITEDSLVYAAKSLKVELRSEQRDRLLGSYLELRTWPDARPALSKLRAAGIRLALLSNFTSSMLHGSIKTSDLDGVFEHIISTDQARMYKPAPQAYKLGVSAFGLPREQILFVAFAGWDAAGAKTFGYPTFWVNRLGLPPEELGVFADSEGKTLNELLAFLGL
jgi:2-haloacid dehalogenase